MKRTLLIGILFCSTHLSQAQVKGLYFNAGVGFSIPVAGQTLDAQGIPFNGRISYDMSSPIPKSFDVQKASFAAGGRALLGFGYMFDENLGIEINVNSVLLSYKYDAYEDTVLNPSGSDYVDVHIQRQMNFPVFATVCAVYNMGGRFLSYYAKGGFVFPLYGKLTDERTYTASFKTNEFIAEEITTKFSAGFTASMGVSYKISPSARIWAEANIMAMSLYVQEGTITAHTKESATYPPDPLKGTVIQYGSNGVYSATNKPTYSVPFSNAGLSLGIALNFKKDNPQSTRLKK